MDENWNSTESKKEERSTVQQQGEVVHSAAGVLPDGQRCRCGCVPNIMGTFEMAALRAKRREILAQAKRDSERKEQTK